VLVIAFLAVATIMGLALLSSASLQAQVAENTTEAISADYLAESGTHIAQYYLRNPQKAPTLNEGTYWPGATGIAVGDSGTVDVTVKPLGNDIYQIVSTGRVTERGGSQLARTVEMRVKLTTEYQVNHAALFNGPITIPANVTINGDIRGENLVSINAGSVLNGILNSLGPIVGTWNRTPDFPKRAVPSLSEINILNELGDIHDVKSKWRPYKYNGSTFHAEKITSSTVNGTLITSNPSGNPANVFYVVDPITIRDLQLDGTLIIFASTTKTPNTLTIRGENRITPKPGMPALIVLEGVQFDTSGPKRRLDVNGVMWVGGVLDARSSGPLSTNDLVVNGALMMGSSSPSILTSVKGGVTVNYVRNNVRVPEFSSENRTPIGITVQQWTGK
jgi:hypothetical protein